MNWQLLQNSLLVSAATAVGASFLGFFSALFAAALSSRLRTVCVAFAIFALVLPPFLVTNCWLHLLGSAGLWRKWLPFDIASFGGAVWILTLLLWPISFFFVLAALRKIERSYFEMEPLLRGWPLLRWLILPMVRNELLQAAILIFVLALNNFAVPAILQVKVFPAELWVDFNTTFNYATALKMSWPMVLLPLIAILIFRRQKISWLWRTDGILPAHFQDQLGKNVFGFSLIVAVFALFFSVAVPLGQLGSSAQTWRDFLPALEAGQSAIADSLFFAACAATLILLIAIFTANLRLGFFAWLPFLIPGVLLGIALIWIFNRPPLTAFYQSAGIVFVGFAIRYCAPSLNLTAQALVGTDKNLVDVAKNEGANAWQIFSRVQLPQIFPQLGAAWYVSYLLCLWDVETLVLIVPPGRETVSLRVFNLLHYGHNSQVNALCVLLLTLAIFPLLIAVFARWFLKKSKVALASALILPFVFLGCSKTDSEKSKTRFAVQSKIFDHVEIIGSRGTAPGQFNKPRSLALDANDSLYVVDMTGRVQKFSANGDYILSWQMPQTDLGKPKGMSRDADGNVIVLEPHYQRLNHFSPDGKLVAQWGKKGTNDGDFILPRSVAMNSRREIFVSEYTTVDRVQVFSPEKKWLFTFGKIGDGAGEMNRPEGVGIDAQDRIYVADSCNHRIQIFSPDGKFLSSFGHAGSGIGELSYPYDVRIDGAGFRFVCEFGNSRIQIFDAKNQPVEILGKAGGAPGEFANPWSIDLDSHGNLYVADSQNHRVQKFVRKNAKTASSHQNSGNIFADRMSAAR